MSKRQQLSQGDDLALVVAWQNGDQWVGACLFERHFDTILRFFRNKVHGPAQDDLLQQTFLRCVENAASFRRASSFRTYLFGIARNVLLEHLRASSRQRARRS